MDRNEQKENKIYARIAAILLLTVTALATYSKIRTGLDIDETYIAYLAYRISQGKILFADSWDIYVTNGVIPAIFTKIYMTVTGSYDGLIIYLRIISAILQAAVSITAYLILKKHYSKEAAFCAAIAIANLLPRATQNLEYGFDTVELFIIMSLMLLDVLKKGGHENRKMMFAGIAYGLAVFVYPTMLITLPWLAIILLTKIHTEFKVRIRYSLIFFGMCLLLFMIFMTYILTHMTFPEFLMNIHGVLEGGDHSTFFSAFTNTDSLKKLIIRPMGLTAGAIIIYIPFRKRLLSPIFICYIYMIIAFTVIIGLNLSGLRPSGPFGLLERYIVYAVMSLFIAIKTRQDPPMLYVFVIMGFLTYLGSLMGSNLGFGENSLYLTLSIVAFVIYTAEHAGTIEDKRLSAFAVICILFMLSEIIFTKGYFVRIDGTGPANITEARNSSVSGVSKHIKVYPEQKEKWNRWREYIQNSSSADHTYVGVTSDPMLDFYFSGETVAPQYVPTLIPDRQWVDYYTAGGHELPDYIYIDKNKYADLSSFSESEFGQYTQNRYLTDASAGSGMFYVLNKK